MFGKFFAQTFTGSMYGAGAVVFAVWSYTIANKDEDGELELNPNLLGGMIGCDPKEIEKAIEYLASPDPGSRSEKEDGRRIVGIGHRFMWRVVNHEEFLAIARREHLRLYNREKKREERERKRGADVKVQSVDVKTCQGSDVHVDVDVDRDVSVSSSKKRSVRKRFKPPTLEEVRAYVEEKGYTFDPEAFHAYYDSQGWKKANGQPVSSWKGCCVTFQKSEPKRQGGKNARPETDYDAALYR
jgi:hypothetical protein